MNDMVLRMKRGEKNIFYLKDYDKAFDEKVVPFSLNNDLSLTR